jgi:membrane protein
LAQYKANTPLEGPGGVRYAGFNPYGSSPNGALIITDKCENPELAFKWADALGHIEATTRSIHGVKDRDWAWATSASTASRRSGRALPTGTTYHIREAAWRAIDGLPRGSFGPAAAGFGMAHARVTGAVPPGIMSDSHRQIAPGPTRDRFPQRAPGMDGRGLMRIPGLGDEHPIDLIRRTFQGFTRDDMATYAAALSYAALFALFPFLIFLIALLGLLHIPQFFDWLLEQAESAFPADAYQRLAEVVSQVQGQSQGGLLSVGIVMALWASSSGVRSLMNALNVAYDVEETRPAWKRYVLSVVYTLGIAVLLGAGAGLMLLGPRSIEWIADQAGLGDVFVTLWTWLRWPVLALLLMIVAALIYYAAPNVQQRFRLITPGAVLAVILWVVASVGFSIYVANFGSYNATYGSLGGVIVLLLYFYISSAVLLLGAELNAEIYRAGRNREAPAEPAPDPGRVTPHEALARR